ncbi:hypothetical protein H9V85_004038 [Salmonella enterica subsp. enterica serovar Louisiana]|nr:hypothetical protein [Salmonella enterica subsp. enterica serovar Louisiana]ECD3929271.1 hypothetical protein [Salmonella enterica subsp. enterica serovar Wangata]ECK8874293.1 hypothetical protein [Salmonella enterica subsp. enterica]EDW5003325.1 hypothetical protein [Salmonella enterica subsp. enterica serovar Isangi]EEE9141773.1 hypothetical protein [Salmonella enterica subsp. enterica serovar Plymouth]EGT0616798.1 hypothetical protein [Salmonella enterica]EGZ3876466.1 hypothetical prote
MNINKYCRNLAQRGISLIEFTLTMLISIPCVIFVQNEVIKIFDDVIANNMVNSFYEIANYIGEDVQNGNFPFYLQSGVYNQISLKQILSNEYFTIALSDKKVQFYIKPERNAYTGNINGYYVLGILLPPSNLKISRLITYDILGSTAGYIDKNNIVSVNGSFGNISMSSDPALNPVPKTATSVVYYGYFPVKKNNQTVIEPHLNPGSVILNGQDLSLEDGHIDLSHCDLTCMNETVLLTWIEQGYRNLEIQLVVGDGSLGSAQLELPAPILPGVYYLSLAIILDAIKRSGLTFLQTQYNPVTLGFYISGTDEQDNPVRVPFIGKINFFYN